MRGNEIAKKVEGDGYIQRVVVPAPFLGVSRQNIRRNIKRWMGNQHQVLCCGCRGTQRQARELISGPDLATRV